MGNPDWTPRYIVGSKNKLEGLLEEDIKLLKEFDAVAIGFGPGIQVQLGAGYGSTTFQMNDASWNWLRPLLVELVRGRRSLSKTEPQDLPHHKQHESS